MPTPQPFYITTPIYYVNDRPHIGHCYTTIVADCAARFMRAAGRDVFFLTGTDEHGQKVEKSAAAAGKPPKALADENAAHFKEALAYVGSSHDHFIRTTDPEHERQVQTALARLIKSGDVYLGTFEGWYDEGQEEYVTENAARERNFKAFNGQPLAKAKEQNYYFRLSAYADRLKKLFADRPEFVRPEARRNEVLGRLNSPEGLQDVPVSRTNFTWGIPIPGAPGHITYVWIDALLNYVTALELLEGDPQSSHLRSPAGSRLGACRAEESDGETVAAGKRRQEAERSKFWPAQVHAMGKEILWFHAVIWPALLMALGLALPECVYAHSFWIRDGKKMSKTLGNFIDLDVIRAYVDAFGLDAWRWFMLTQGPLGATDADFSHAKFVEVYNSDLANGIGNAFSRVSNMIEKYFAGKCPNPKDYLAEPSPVIGQGGSAFAQVGALAAAFEPDKALTQALALTRTVDQWIHATEPFKLARDPANLPRVGRILYDSAEAIRIAATLLTPAIPKSMGELLRRMGREPPDAKGRFSRPLEDLCKWGELKPGTPIVKGEPLFPRADPKADPPRATDHPGAPG